MSDQKITELTDYTPPIDADVVPVVDTVSGITKKLTWANIKATLKTYFDTLYSTAVKATGAEVDTGTDDAKYMTSKSIADSSYEKNPMTTAGDIIYGGVDGLSTRLGIGSDDQVLTLASGVPTWADAGGSGSNSFSWFIS